MRVFPCCNTQEKVEHVPQPQGIPSQQGKKVGVVCGDGSIEKMTNIASSLASQLAAVNSALERYIFVVRLFHALSVKAISG